MARTSKAIGEEPLLLLVDANAVARRAAVLKEAAKELGDVAGQEKWRNLQVIVVHPSEALEYIARQGETLGVVILVVIAEEGLSLLTDGQRIPRTACDSVSCGYSLLAQVGQANDVYFVARDDKITAVDTVSLLLSGARGVLEMDALGSVEVLRIILGATQESNKPLNRIVIGRPCDQLNALKEAVHARWQMALQHWKLLIALAQIPLLRFPATGNQPTQTGIAGEMSKWSDVTGYMVTKSTERQLPLVLEFVSEELNVGPEEEGAVDDRYAPGRRQLTRAQMYELPYLPMYARLLGLPSQLLPIDGIDDSNLDDQLYKGLRGLEIASTSSAGDFPIGHITIPRDLWR